MYYIWELIELCDRGWGRGRRMNEKRIRTLATSMTAKMNIR